jgi:succinyl-CoA synthetase alpha subunit
MSSEIALLLSRHGFGQSTVVGLGGNILIGTTFADLVDEIEFDPQTKAVVIIGEIGGSYEEDLAAKLQSMELHKPYLAFVSGRFAETLPKGMSFGHAGAIVDASVGTRSGKVAALAKAGVRIVENPSEFIGHLKNMEILDKEQYA